MKTGNKKAERTGFKKRYGFLNAEVLAVNPESNEDIADLGFYVFEDAKEPEYVGKKDVEVNGKTVEAKWVRLDFYVKEMKTIDPYQDRISFFITDLPKVSKAGNTCYINAQGETQWVAKESQLRDRFKVYDVREAKQGEPELFDFLRKLYNMDWAGDKNIPGSGGKVEYDLKKWFSGNFKELQKDVMDEDNGSVIIPITIKHKDITDPETGETSQKDVQSFYKAFASGADWKVMEVKKMFTAKDVEKIQADIEFNKTIPAQKQARPKEYIKYRYITDLQKIVASLTDLEYGCKDSYYLGILKEYDENDVPVGVAVDIREDDDTYN